MKYLVFFFFFYHLQGAASVGVHATTGDAPLEGHSPPRNGRHIDFSSEHFGSRNLRSSMEHLHEEVFVDPSLSQLSHYK